MQRTYRQHNWAGGHKFWFGREGNPLIFVAIMSLIEKDFSGQWLEVLQPLLPDKDQDSEGSDVESAENEQDQNTEELTRKEVIELMQGTFRSEHFRKGPLSFLTVSQKPSVSKNVKRGELSISVNDALVFAAHINNLNVGGIIVQGK